MEKELLEKIKEQDAKLEAIWESMEKIRKYFLIVFWVSIVTFILPLIALLILGPYFLKMYLGSFEGLL